MAAEKLDRLGITQAIAEMLQADTDILYGTGKYLQIIEYGIADFNKTKVNVKKPFGLYLFASDESAPEVRSQNTDNNYLISLRFSALQINPQTAYSVIDNAYERVKYLVNDQMWGGAMMTDYFTDTTAQIFNLEPTGSTADELIEDDNSLLRVNIDGAILVEVTRWKQ